MAQCSTEGFQITLLIRNGQTDVTEFNVSGNKLLPISNHRFILMVKLSVLTYLKDLCLAKNHQNAKEIIQ